MTLAELLTPAAVVDLDLVERNASRMAARCAALGVALRPHVKTHKCVPAARLQLGDRPGGLTVSTLAEARHLAHAGFLDLVYAVPVGPRKLTAIGELLPLLERLALLVDHPATVAEVAAFAAARRRRLDCLIEVDCGGRRTGVCPEGDAAERLAAAIASSPWLELRGVLTHAGHAYACRDLAEAALVAAEERDVAVAVARRLRAAGLPAPEVSVGSTPTLAAVDHLEGVTEARPGNYVFYDAFQLAIGSCGADDLAFTVLVEVIALHPERGELVVDGGALALSKDPGPVHVDPVCGFGLVRALDGRPLPGLRVAGLTQEHGVVRADDPRRLAAHGVGSLLRIVPNHACLAAALFDRYAVIRDDEVVDEWRPARGW